MKITSGIDSEELLVDGLTKIGWFWLTSKTVILTFAWSWKMPSKTSTSIKYTPFFPFRDMAEYKNPESLSRLNKSENKLIKLAITYKYRYYNFFNILTNLCFLK